MFFRLIQKKTHKYRKVQNYFTLLELTVSLAAFVTVITIVFELYNSASRVSQKAETHSAAFENATIALDIFNRDIQCIFYGQGTIPFWHWKPDSSQMDYSKLGIYRNELLAFVSRTDLPQNSKCISPLNEIKYQLYYSKDKNDPNFGWLRRSATGDRNYSGKKNKKWNFYHNFSVGYTSKKIEGFPLCAFTANSVSSENYQKIIPYVTNIQFICYDTLGNVIKPDRTTSSKPGIGNTTAFPTSIDFRLTLMDKTSWKRWLVLLGDGGFPEKEPAKAKDYREKNESTFSSLVYIGNRGQFH